MNNFYFSDWFFLIASSIVFISILWSLQKPSSYKIWIKIWSQPLATISAGVLILFWGVAILDSIHINDLTLIDKVFYPLNIFSEYSYSKPCAITSFLPKVFKVNGEFITRYTHLTYVPKEWQSLKQVNSWLLHILFRTFILMVFPWMAYLYFTKHARADWPSYKKNILLFLSTLIVLGALLVFLFIASRHLHVFGTSQAGYDIFYQAIKSIRTGLMISVMTTLFMLPFAILLGLLAGFFGSWVDYIIQFIYTVISSIPTVLLITAGILAWQFYASLHFTHWSMYELADMRLVMICILLGISNWSSLCRYIRAEVLKLRELDYIKMALLLQTPKWKILWRHLLPNIMHLVIMNVVLDFSYLVLAESVLTYIGVGVSPLTQSWGNMINAARLELARDPIVWWPLWTAFSFMFPLVLSCNIFADACRKALNPREVVG